MGKVTIYISLKDGKLEYRNSEKHKGKSIETKVKTGDKIIWTLDNNSGISDLSGINIMGSCKFLSKGPAKKSCDKWVAMVNKKAKGEISYEIFYTAVKSESKESAATLKSASSASGGDPPKLIIRV